MKKCRKILLILAAAVFAFALFALTACGGDEGDGDEVSIALDKPTLTLTEGADATLTATVKNSDEAVVWTVTLGNETVITITTEGNVCTVTAVAEGAAKVKATVGEKSAECAVTVKAEDGEEGEVSITLNKKSLTLKPEATATLTATVKNSDEEVEWTVIDTSLDEEVEGAEFTNAIVSIEKNGNTCTVTALAEGSAKITAKVGDKTAECIVTVTAEGDVGGGDEGDDNLPKITTWGTVGDATYGDANDNGIDSIYHHIFLDDVVDKAYDFDSYTATVTLDGVAGKVLSCSTFGAPDIEAHTYHMHIRIEGNRYQTAVFTITFMKDGEEVAKGIYTREGERNLTLSPSKLTLTLKKDETVTETITATKSGKVEGTIDWSINDEEVAIITVNEDGTVTAVAAGTATITAEVDGLTKTCTVTVLEEGGTVTIPTVTKAEIVSSYGGGVHCHLHLLPTDELADTYAEVLTDFAYVKVNGVKNNDMKDMFPFGEDGTYRVNVYMGGAIQENTDYVFELCDADGNVLLKTVALQWDGTVEA